MDKLLSEAIIAITENEPNYTDYKINDLCGGISGMYLTDKQAFNLKYKPMEALEWKDSQNERPPKDKHWYWMSIYGKVHHWLIPNPIPRDAKFKWIHAEPYEAAKAKQELICPLNVDGRVWELVEGNYESEKYYECGEFMLIISDSWISLDKSGQRLFWMHPDYCTIKLMNQVITSIISN